MAAPAHYLDGPSRLTRGPESIMSDTSKTKTRRQLKQKSMGKKRKKALEKNGTTPKFPIHKDKND